MQSWYTLGFQVKTKSQAVQSYLGTKTRSAVLCKRAGVQEAVQILGLKFSSEDEKSGKVTWEQKARSAVQCRREREAPASCSCLHRSLISTFQNAIL